MICGGRLNATLQLMSSLHFVDLSSVVHSSFGEDHWVWGLWNKDSPQLDRDMGALILALSFADPGSYLELSWEDLDEWAGWETLVSPELDGEAMFFSARHRISEGTAFLPEELQLLGLHDVAGERWPGGETFFDSETKWLNQTSKKAWESWPGQGASTGHLADAENDNFGVGYVHLPSMPDHKIEDFVPALDSFLTRQGYLRGDEQATEHLFRVLEGAHASSPASSLHALFWYKEEGGSLLAGEVFPGVGIVYQGLLLSIPPRIRCGACCAAPGFDL